MTSNERTQNVGILGGGQLGCMLADAAFELGLAARIFAEISSPAAALYADRVTLGKLTDEKSLRGFFKQVSVVIFENEFLDCDLLERAAQGLNVRFAPGIPAIRELQDKLRQKEMLLELRLPTADFLPILPGSDVEAEVARAYSNFGGQVVFKWSRMGYDGKGVCLAKDTPVGRAEALAFCRKSLDRGVRVYAEYKIAFKRELAIIGCRALNGDFAAYPLVLSEQEHGICKRVLGPASALGVPLALETEAREAARKIAEAMKLEGCFAVELFETPEGGLAINEIAPRVHNSGHYTQDACRVSQFENHWRAALGHELGQTDTSPAFGMLNLLGPEGSSLAVPQRRAELPFPAVPSPLRLHWYAKAEIRPWRKVGHLNAALGDVSGLPGLIRQFEDYQLSWTRQIAQLQSLIRTPL